MEDTKEDKSVLVIEEANTRVLKIVNDALIVELKAVKALAPEHFGQIINYLKITHNPIGLLINFGSYRFERRTVVA